MTTSSDPNLYPEIPYGMLGQDQEAFFGARAAERLPRQGLMLKWRKAVANVRTGIARGTLLFLGDSTTMGAGAGTGGSVNLNAAFARSLPARASAILNTTFVSSSFQSVWGNQNTQITYATYDPRVSLGTGWTMSGGGTLGSTFLRFSTGATGTLAFTPPASCDTVTIYYYVASGNGTFTVNVDGGASLGTINTAGTTSFASTTYSFAAGTHTINLNAQNDGSLFVSGIIPKLSTTPAIDVVSGAWYGSIAGTFNSAGSFGPLTALRALAPDCTVINLTINDSNAGTDLGTYQGNLQGIITAAQASGDVVLMVGAPSDTAAATNGQLDSYISVIYALAEQYDCAVVDLRRRWGSYDAIQPTFPYFDTLHPGNLGYADVGQAVASALMFQ
jgi:lysophospholipase L1-like esterase